MSHSQHMQHTSRSHELFIGGDTDSKVYMELVLGHSAAKAARDQGCFYMNIEVLAHARRAIDIAREHHRPDLEEKAQLGKAEFLLMMGCKRESLEVEILVAARAEGLEVEQRADGSVVSVGGVPMDEVARLLENAARERKSLEVEIVTAAEAEGLAIEEGEDGGIVSVGGVPMDEVVKRFKGTGVRKMSSSSSGMTSQHKTGNGGDTTNAGGSRRRAGSSAPCDPIWNNVVQRRRVRDARNHLVTVTSAKPKLRRKPAFKTS
ncbi:hypothetical protein VMCG_09141 [Cytospora schulzeri]|uniref:Uncharacterized protein n=1 Tax=Cytospora schulzeri TaxID=448051 RepID=A0A423VMY5_9PEZI|nr:hypothetical protein VMCG_09141 [Valsa malicola]